ncbi:hypothetical protein [Streptomyces albiaxialis]|uniref:hypothetical protein n=1 Tax=Streptomyces albiaxialis TaxID=329523 RepID=UPI0031E4260B
MQEAARIVREGDAQLARYRQALDAGGSPQTIGRWIAEVEARRDEARRALAEPAASDAHRVTKGEIKAMIKPMNRISDLLAQADPTTKPRSTPSSGSASPMTLRNN